MKTYKMKFYTITFNCPMWTHWHFRLASIIEWVWAWRLCFLV